MAKFMNKRVYNKIKDKFGIRRPSLSKIKDDSNVVTYDGIIYDARTEFSNSEYNRVSSLIPMRINLDRAWQKDLVRIEMLKNV